MEAKSPLSGVARGNLIIVRKLIAASMAVGFVVFFAHQSANADTVIGRWCDRTVPNLPKYNQIITILINTQGEAEAHSKFNDGSSGKSKLKETSGQIFVKLDSSSGDKFRISPSTGKLQLLDNYGLIRVAKRLENKLQAGECR